MTEVRRELLLAGLVLLLPIAVVAWATQVARAQAPPPAADVWAPVRFMVGRWEGTSVGQPGSGTVRRAYEFILDDRYLHETNPS